jgi:hypothetical protein
MSPIRYSTYVLKGLFKNKSNKFSVHMLTKVSLLARIPSVICSFRSSPFFRLHFFGHIQFHGIFGHRNERLYPARIHFWNTVKPSLIVYYEMSIQKDFESPAIAAQSYSSAPINFYESTCTLKKSSVFNWSSKSKQKTVYVFPGLISWVNSAENFQLPQAIHSHKRIVLSNEVNVRRVAKEVIVESPKSEPNDSKKKLISVETFQFTDETLAETFLQAIQADYSRDYFSSNLFTAAFTKALNGEARKNIIENNDDSLRWLAMFPPTVAIDELYASSARMSGYSYTVTTTEFLTALCCAAVDPAIYIFCLCYTLTPTNGVCPFPQLLDRLAECKKKLSDCPTGTGNDWETLTSRLACLYQYPSAAGITTAGTAASHLLLPDVQNWTQTSSFKNNKFEVTLDMLIKMLANPNYLYYRIVEHHANKM